MSTVNDILARTPGRIWTVSPGDSVFTALQAMANGQVGAVLVVEGGRLVGIFTERDLSRKIALTGKNTRSTTVASVMTESVVYVGPTSEVDYCLALMTAKRVRHLPVLDDGQLVGIVSIADLVSRSIADQGLLIDQLECSTTGGGFKRTAQRSE